MKNFTQLWQGGNVAPLLAAIEEHPDLWKEDTYLRDYPQGPFGDTETIMIRFPEKAVFDLEHSVDLYKAGKLEGFDQHECIWYPASKLLPMAVEMACSLMYAVKGERLGRVMINKLKPGGRIFPHPDTPEHCAYYNRFHFVVQSNEDVYFRCGNEVMNWQQGDVFGFNNALEHEVINNGTTDRIHMVVDLHFT
jgi:hypothetical protein